MIFVLFFFFVTSSYYRAQPHRKYRKGLDIGHSSIRRSHIRTDKRHIHLSQSVPSLVVFHLLLYLYLLINRSDIWMQAPIHLSQRCISVIIYANPFVSAVKSALLNSTFSSIVDWVPHHLTSFLHDMAARIALYNSSSVSRCIFSA